MGPTAEVFQIVALVKPFRTAAVLDGLGAVEVLGGTIREAMGYGRQKNRLHQYLGSEYSGSFLPKVELTIFVRQAQVDAAIRIIVDHARTGRIGDGKIMVTPCLGQYVVW